MVSRLNNNSDKVRVSEVFDLRMGKTPSRKNPAYWQEGNHDWVSIADLGSFGKYVGKTKERINDLAICESGIKAAPANTVLMSFKLSLGKTSITKEPVYTNEAIMAFVDKGVYSVDPSFMYHQCRTKDWNAGTNTAVMGKTLNKKTLGQAFVFLPSLEEQKMIASKLDVIDKQMEELTKILEQLDALVKSRFIEMFGDCKSGYKCRLQKLGSLLSVEPQNGLYKPQKYYVAKGGVPIVRVDAFQRGFIEDFGSLKRLDCSKIEVDTYGLNENDIVINRVNGSIERVGKIAWIRELIEPTVFESNMMRFHVDESKLELPYITVFLNSDDIRQQIKARARIANQCSINQGNVTDFDIPLPPLSLQQQFASFVAEVDKSKSIAQKQVDKLQMLYDSLAQEYFGD